MKVMFGMMLILISLTPLVTVVSMMDGVNMGVVMALAVANISGACLLMDA